MTAPTADSLMEGEATRAEKVCDLSPEGVEKLIAECADLRDTPFLAPDINRVAGKAASTLKALVEQNQRLREQAAGAQAALQYLSCWRASHHTGGDDKPHRFTARDWVEMEDYAYRAALSLTPGEQTP